jgi:hypothetical protein
MNSKAEESDFREPEFPADRVIALEAIIDAKGQKPPSPPCCMGYANCCRCPACQLGPRRRIRPRNFSKESIAA